MKSKHITQILDNAAFAELNKEDLAAIRDHVGDCQNCRQAFRAAHASSILLKVKSEIPAPLPSPFFQAKLINALRERQNLQKPIEAFHRWWQASAAMVGLMVMIVVSLVAASLIAPSAIDDEAQAGTNFNLYSTDTIILNQKSPRDLTNEQVFQVIYNPRNDFKKVKMNVESKNKWQIRAATLSIFLLGFVAGGFALNAYHLFGAAKQPTRRERFDEAFSRVGLNETQKIEVQRIVGETREKIHRLRQEDEPRIQEIRAQNDEHLQKIFTPEQWQEFQKARDEIRGADRHNHSGR